MKTDSKTIERVHNMSFSKVYPMYITKAERKNRTKSEVDQIIFWLTGYTEKTLKIAIEKQINFKDFFTNAPKPNPNRILITGSICGVKIDEITDQIYKEVRYLDKLIDELAKGKSMEKILRKSNEN